MHCFKRCNWGFPSYVVRCAMWYHLHNLKNVKKTHGEVLILVKLQSSAWNFTKINIPPWIFFTFFKLCKWYQIKQRPSYRKQSINFHCHECSQDFLAQTVKQLAMWEHLWQHTKTIRYTATWRRLTTNQEEILNQGKVHQIIENNEKAFNVALFAQT